MMNKLRAAAKKEVGLRGGELQMYLEGVGWLKEYLLKLLNLRLTVSVYDFVQGYEAMHFQTAVMMIRVMNFNINHKPLHELYTGL